MMLKESKFLFLLNTVILFLDGARAFMSEFILCKRGVQRFINFVIFAFINSPSPFALSVGAKHGSRRVERGFS